MNVERRSSSTLWFIILYSLFGVLLTHKDNLILPLAPLINFRFL